MTPHQHAAKKQHINYLLWAFIFFCRYFSLLFINALPNIN